MWRVFIHVCTSVVCGGCGVFLYMCVLVWWVFIHVCTSVVCGGCLYMCVHQWCVVGVYTCVYISGGCKLAGRASHVPTLFIS